MNASASVSISVANRLEAALLGGRNSEDAMRDIVEICDSDPDAPWEVLALVDQYYRRGRISDATFRAVNSQIQRFAVGGPAARAAARASLRDTPPPGPVPPPAAEPPSALGENSEARPHAPARGTRQIDVVADDVFVDEAAAGGRGGVQRAAEPATPLRALPAGTILSDRYVLEAPLDHGTRDTVYRAIDHFRAGLPLEEQRVVVKISARADTHRRFFRVLPLAHPAIARVLECGRDRGLDFYTLEFHRGKLLRDVLREMAGPLQRRHALSLIREIGAAVVYAHEQGVVHGALDPKNIMITLDGAILVLNFDTSDSEHADTRHDLHALACIAYELFAGAKPFPGHDAVSARQAGLRAKRPPHVSLRQWRALKQGLAWSSGMKPLAVKAWLRRLDLEHAAPRLPILTQLMTQKAAPRWSPLMTSAAVAVVAAAVVAAIALVDMPTLSARHTAPPAPALLPAAAAAVMPPVAPPSDAPMSAAPSTEPTRSPETTAPSSNDHPGRIGFAADSMSVPPDAPAARIVVRRTAGTRGDVGFSWWTENGSALAGEDYISLGTKQMTIPDGEDSVTLFVPLVAPGATQGRADFSVVLGKPTGGAMLGGISRITVNLTSRH